MKSIPAKRLPTFFYAMVLGSLAFSAAYLLLRRGEGFAAFFYQNGTNWIGDFSNNLHYPTHQGGPYFDGIWASFPPLAYTLYYLMNVGVTRAQPTLELVMYVVITAFTFMALLYGVQRILETYGKGKRTAQEALAFSLCVLLSGVSVYTIERGNSVLNVMVLMLFPLYLRESKKAWQREAALVLIAVAAAMKIYPCLLGLLYLLEKRYKESVRLVIYGVALFVIPFAWFGGVAGFQQFLYNQQAIHALYRNDFFTSIPSVASFVGTELGWDIALTSAVSKGIAYAFGAVLLGCVLLTDKLWLRCLLLMSFSILVPGWSAEYMALYLALPCVLYLCESPEVVRPKDVAYMLLFGGVFICLPFGAGFGLHAPLSWNMLVCFGCIYLLAFLAVGDVAVTFWRARKARTA